MLKVILRGDVFDVGLALRILIKGDARPAADGELASMPWVPDDATVRLIDHNCKRLWKNEFRNPVND
jgi:hypothetical protein